jgi:hypothetical protein
MQTQVAERIHGDGITKSKQWCEWIKQGVMELHVDRPPVRDDSSCDLIISMHDRA